MSDLTLKYPNLYDAANKSSDRAQKLHLRLMIA
jgi:hypothetical protein